MEWRWLLGAALLALLAVAIGPARLTETLSAASPAWISLIAILACVWLLLGALNVWLLLRHLAPVGLGVFVHAYIAGWAALLVIPGQFGDASQVLLLRRAGVPAASSVAAYSLDKLVSLSWLAVVTAYGIGRYTQYHPGVWLLGALLAAVGAVVAVMLLLQIRPAPRTWLLRGQTMARHAISQLLLFRAQPVLVCTNALLTLGKWLLTTALYLAAFRAVGASVGFEAAATIPVMSSLVGYLPLTVAGIGTMEVTAVVLFDTLGVSAAAVLSAYLLVRGVLMIEAGLLLTLIAIRRRRAAAA